MSVHFTADIELDELYLQHFQPAKHPGDEHRQTRVSYLGELKKLNDFFWFRAWLARFNRPPRQTSTAELTADFQWWLEHCERPPHKVRLCDCSDALVVGAMNWRIELGWERTTANKLRRTVNAVWNWGARELNKSAEQSLLKRPDNQKYRENVGEPIAFLPDELERILKACARRRGVVGKVRAADWWLACVLFVFSTGLRIGAALKVRTRDIDWTRGEILAGDEAAKGRKAQRLDLLPSAVAALRALCLSERSVPLVLGDWPFNVNTLRRHFAQILVDAGIFADASDVPRELKFHALRKTLGSQIIAEAGLHVACDRLGHSSVEVTKRYRDRRYQSQHRITELVKDPLPMLPTSGPPELRIAEVG